MNFTYIIYILLFVLIYFIIIYTFNYVYDQLQINKLKKYISKLESIEIKNLSNFYDIPTYYINLDSSKDRFSILDSVIKKYNIKNIKRFSAVNAKDLENQNNHINSNYLSCVISHLKVIETAYKNNQDYALILEDDISLKSLFLRNESLNDIIKKDKNFGIIQLFNNKDWNETNKKKKEELNYDKSFTTSTKAYIISKKGMEVFIPYINNTNLIKNVADIFIFEKILESKLKILFYGNYFSINIFSSTLNNNNKLKIRSSNNFFNNNFKYI